MHILILSALAAIVSLLAGFGAERLSKPVPLVGNFVRLVLSYNPDIAFSIALPYPFKELLIILALIAVLVLAFRSHQNKLSSLAFGLILGGAVANLFDRLPDGVVTDFIAIGTFPIFNLADACISIGAGLLLMESMKKKSTMST
jgi:signal peptidase II